MVNQHAKIYVAGGQTLIGNALLRQLEHQGYTQVFGGSADAPDLTDAAAVDAFFEQVEPDYVFLAAGESGGILANQRYPAQLMLDNLLVECNVIPAAHRHGVTKLLYLASSCSYPKLCPQPMEVKSLMTGPLEPTNEAYAIAKIAGLKLCQAYQQQYGVDFITAIPANAFGIGDDFGLESSHVIPALIHKMHRAKIEGQDFVEVWGTGSPRREFVFADDLADACLFLMAHYDDRVPINIGGGTDLSIGDLAQRVKQVVGYRGELRFDSSKPDGMPLKALDSSPLQALGWRPSTPLDTALEATYSWFLKQESRKSPTYV
ncbi:GDP-L-fucose synthase family protein [Nodosilinea nodulosa]|uniref:GDP-L-fucose synthase family protein n=1 Tax=Nodosilinea nodulosa TaxID=416001 RepID=UPI0002E07F76|nr:GDP-L-fucose synthase [Nodosilinea nodulosa]